MAYAYVLNNNNNNNNNNSVNNNQGINCVVFDEK